jgi:Cys-rich protein (TIGR01571 family)
MNPAVTATQMIEVIAPATLPEGYTFEAQLSDGRKFMVAVPKGGVEENQRFMIPVAPTAKRMIDGAPVGAWKDGLCGCFRCGLFHPHLWLAYCCQPIALAQVMTRERLNWLGSPGSVAEVAATFKRVVLIFVACVILKVFLSALYVGLIFQYAHQVTPDYTMNDNVQIPASAAVVNAINQALSYAYLIYLLVATLRTRASIRDKYAIPEQSCKGCEDCCCSYWCSCCTVAQMMRHTADYDKYDAQCCTETGLPPLRVSGPDISIV